jgi:peptidoglycan biosynthesis protein MviN/MurJ (putative lipid II flippase)
VAARSFYARKEPWFPFFAVVLRLVIFLAIGITGVLAFRSIGAPMIAIAEIALLIEAIVLFTWLSNRMHEPIRVEGAVLRGLLAAVIGGLLAYLIAWLVPGGAITTAVLGMSVGAIVALPIIWPEVRLLLHL